MAEPRPRPLLLLVPLLAALGGCAENSLSMRGGADEESGAVYAPEDPFVHEDDDDSLPPDGDDDDQAGGWVEVVSYDPPAGADDHHYRAPIRVHFSDAALSASVSLFDGATGYLLPVEQEWSSDARTLTVWPVGWLEPLAEYAVAIDLGDASLEYRFSTSSIGTPVGPEDDPDGAASLLDGRLYEIEFAQARADDGSNLGGLLPQLDEGPAWLWQVSFGESTQVLDLNTGLADVDADGNAEEQDLCTATQLLGTSDSPVLLADPYFSSAPGLVTLDVDGAALVFEDGWVDGDFAPDGASLVEIGFRGWLREDGVEAITSTDGCKWIEGQIGTTCQPCPSGDGLCAWIEVAGLRGVQTSIDFASVDPGDVGECPDPLEVLGCQVAAPGRAVPLLSLLVAGGAMLLRRRS